jgi:pyruvate dehydrogenase E1 component alpha subunit
VWSAVFNAPIVFFCQNNQYAISQPMERQSRVPLYRRAAGFGFPGTRVDGNDVLAVYAVTRKAVDAARRGNGPSLIEAYTYRMGAHTTSDDPRRYRVAGEVEAWQARDPITRVRRFLERERLAGAAFFDEVAESAESQARDLRERVLAMPDPAPETLFDHVYAEESALIDAERAEFAAYHARVAERGY